MIFFFLKDFPVSAILWAEADSLSIIASTGVGSSKLTNNKVAWTNRGYVDGQFTMESGCLAIRIFQ